VRCRICRHPNRLLVAPLGTGSPLLSYKFHVRGKPMPEETIFSKIIRREVPATILFQDDRVTAFKDINAKAPTHIVIVPNKIIPSLNDVTPQDEGVLGYLFVVAARLAKEQGIAQNGYRLIVNCGRHGGQEVYHLHMHLMGGRSLGPMLVPSD
jgi:histidine triad (HIT) family protein